MSGTTLGEADDATAHARRIEAGLVLTCDPARLYPGGAGFPGDAALLARLRGRVSPRTEVLAELFAGFPAHAPGPPVLFGGSAAFRAAQGARLAAPRPAGPPSLLCATRDVRLSGNALFLVEEGGPRVLFETFRPQDRHVVDGPGPDFARIDETVPEAGITVLLNSAGSFNYGHWLVDDLPRLRAVAWLRKHHPRVPITIALVAFFPHIDEARRRSIRLFLGREADVAIRFLDRTKTYRFAHLHHATPCSLPTTAKSPEALRFLAAQVRAATRGARWRAGARGLAGAFLGRRPSRRLFVDRHPGRGRALSNRAAVLDVLRAHGFEPFDPELVSVRQQALRFSGAEIVVGIAGAGMANAVFCAAGTPLVHLVPEGWEDVFYAETAAACGQSYRAVFGPRIPADGPEHLHDFSVDPADLRAALASVGLPGT